MIDDHLGPRRAFHQLCSLLMTLPRRGRAPLLLVLHPTVQHHIDDRRRPHGRMATVRRYPLQRHHRPLQQLLAWPIQVDAQPILRIQPYRNHDAPSKRDTAKRRVRTRTEKMRASRLAL